MEREKLRKRRNYNHEGGWNPPYNDVRIRRIARLIDRPYN